MGAACCRCQQVAFEDDVLRFASAATVGVSSSRHPIQALQLASSASNSSSSRRSVSSQSSTSSSPLQARSLLPRHRTRLPSRQSVSMNHSLANYVSFPFPWANKVEAKRSSRAKTATSSKNATTAPSSASKRAKMNVLCSLTCTMGDHYREAEDGSRTPLPLTELCVRRVCTTLVTDPEYYGERHPGMSSEVASMLVAFLKQHEALTADHFQLLSRYLYHEWNLGDQLELESGWFDSIATSPLQHVKSINFKNCANLESLGSDRWQRVDELPNLMVATFQDCVKLSKSVPDVLQHSTRLTSLNLSGCRNIDDRSLIPLRRLFLLKTLELSGCRLISDDGLKCLTGLSKLEKLVLSRCTLLTDHGFEKVHRAFPRLRHLDVAHCRISDIALVHIGRATSLRALIVRGCHQIGDPGIEHLAALHDLEYFDARHCEDVPSLRSEWTKMKSLLLARTAFSEAESTVLKSMPQLTDLDVRACKILKRGFECISQLLNLKRLTLAETALTDAALLQICKGVKGLIALSISHTEITDEGAEGLANLVDLKMLHMDTNGITNRALSSLAGLVKLRVLDLFGTSVSDNGLQHLSGLTELRELVICSGGITDRGVEVLSRLTSLQTLNLSQNRCIHSKGLLSLRSLANLQNLNLSNTAVSVVSLRHLHPLKNLESLSIFGCVVTSTEVEMLQELLPSLRTLRCS